MAKNITVLSLRVTLLYSNQMVIPRIILLMSLMTTSWKYHMFCEALNGKFQHRNIWRCIGKLLNSPAFVFLFFLIYKLNINCLDYKLNINLSFQRIQLAATTICPFTSDIEFTWIKIEQTT